jgi:hypothetical protein
MAAGLAGCICAGGSEPAGATATTFQFTNLPKLCWLSSQP